MGCSPEVRRVTAASSGGRAPWCLRWRATDLGARVVAAASNPISSSSSPPSAEEPLFLFGVDNDEDEMIQVCALLVLPLAVTPSPLAGSPSPLAGSPSPLAGSPHSSLHAHCEA